ncbi:hypothetical protein WICPIJ_005632 [Wickerhamomyces pijperi]|uniref:Uncharacterized protein n=1 Tax=Wickerhamomyces pijperi TaxID=599730 RepID=A0A9P8Q373_WICPI|nr:hypothetical protein WICPIJ_005632 [Wickerhamomyces pijperi]
MFTQVDVLDQVRHRKVVFNLLDQREQRLLGSAVGVVGVIVVVMVVVVWSEVTAEVLLLVMWLVVWVEWSVVVVVGTVLELVVTFLWELAVVVLLVWEEWLARLVWLLLLVLVLVVVVTMLLVPGWAMTTEALNGTHFSLPTLTAGVFFFLSCCFKVTALDSTADGQCLVSMLELDLEDSTEDGAVEPQAETLGTGAGAKETFSIFGEVAGEGNCICSLDSEALVATSSFGVCGSSAAISDSTGETGVAGVAASKVGVVAPEATTLAYDETLADMLESGL